MTELANTAATQGLEAIAANDVNDTPPPIVLINLQAEPRPKASERVSSYSTFGVPEFWEGDFNLLDFLPIPSSSGRNIFNAYAGQRNAPLTLAQHFLKNPPPWANGKYYFLGTILKPLHASRMSPDECVYGIEIKDAEVTETKLRSKDHLSSTASAVVFRR